MSERLDPASTHGATPIDAALSQPVSKAPARVREKKLRESTSSLAPSGDSVSDLPPDYQALDVPADQVPHFEQARQDFQAIGRLETSQVFERGAIITSVLDLAPDQKVKELWAQGIFKATRRGAENYENVHKRLQSHRHRLVALSLPATSLYELAKAEPDQVEAITARMEEQGKILTGAHIKAIVSGGEDATAAVDVAAAGGPAGLKAMIAAKTAGGVPALMDNAADFLRDIHVALDPHRKGKRVEKGTMKPVLIHRARLIRQQLESLIWMAVPAGAPYPEGIVHVRPVVTGDAWHELQKLLDRLGDFENWPSTTDFGPWLADTVVPQFEWLLGPRGEKAAAVIAEMEKAAEAEKARAAKEKAKAKAEAAKERKKAKGRSGKAKAPGAAPSAADDRSESDDTVAPTPN